MPRSSSRAAPGRLARADGDDTRRRLIEAAGQLFAERGAERTTAKDICARADVHLAAVNYHFGDRDGLHAAVLVAAHAQLVALDDLQAIAASAGSPKARLERLLRQLIARMSASRQPWGLKVLVQEMLAPSSQAPALVRDAIAPKSRVLLGLVADVLGVPASHPAVQRAALFAVLPCLVMLVAPRPLRRQVLPAVEGEGTALADDYAAWAMSGLAAWRRRLDAARSAGEGHDMTSEVG